jgi:hypothetical protein
VLGRYGWLVAATASVGMTAGSYLIFTTLLKLHLQPLQDENLLALFNVR